MKQAYISKTFNESTMRIIVQANEFIEKYQEEGLNLTLRQLYYQFVSKDLIPNKQSQYKRLGRIISDARLAGHIDWDAIVDRTRRLNGNAHWLDPGSIIRSARRSFMVDHWEGQEFRPEIWIEKEALIGVIEDICEELDVDYFACKGYVSQSSMYEAYQRLDRVMLEGQTPVIIHLGDHDPSGIDITRDIGARQDLFGGGVRVVRLALNMDQVETYNPPPNPAKLTDSRVGDYLGRFGDKSWELDALEPSVLVAMIEHEVCACRDEATYIKTIQKEKKYKAVLKRVEENWKTL